MIRRKISLSFIVLSFVIIIAGCGSVNQTSNQNSDSEASGASINESRATGVSAVRGVWLTNVEDRKSGV
ncbi:MAG: hypothetical protein HBSAPP04_26490 [Ignavibacteriaceae bacterium]|nr:MAG: hypothetical protein HBSAPP04_26490 [Ignavibacteriaceae bacterium]